MKEKLNAEIKFRLESDLKESLIEISKQDKISVSEYLRKIINHEIHNRTTLKNIKINKKNIQMNAEINNNLQKYMEKFSGATNNINQITRKSHENNSISNHELEKIIHNQKEMKEILVRIFKGVAILWRQSQSKKQKI